MANRKGSPPPSLAHPVLFPSLAGNTKQTSAAPKHPVPGYPEIDSDWQGVYFDTLRCPGVNRALFEGQPFLGGKPLPIFNLVARHEVNGHYTLRDTLISQLMRLNTLKMHDEIDRLCRGVESLKIHELYSPNVRIRKLTDQVTVPLAANGAQHA